MQSTPETKTVDELVDLYRNKMLVANPEYQRGEVWSSSQKKKLIDSVMRGYPLPLIYLHHIEKVVAKMRREDLEIIDGQQRITALYEFAEGAFTLFDPSVDNARAKFPKFLVEQPCPWGGKNFTSLPSELQERFLQTPLAITQIETDSTNEVRDLFVRLQSGLPLNAQETRDAWPGQFTDFVLSLGGKPQIAKYPGHAFFHGPMGLTSQGDRGKARQFSAQIASLFLTRREQGGENVPDINAQAINDFYFSHVDFDRNSPDARRLVEILDKLHALLLPGKRPRLKAHDAIHLVLLVDTLLDDYTRSWEKTLPEALDRFMHELAKAKAGKDAEKPSEFWLRYGQWTRVNSDRGERIAHRHQFYMEKMFEYLEPLQLKDPQRLFGEFERQVIFFQSSKRCAVCDSPVSWEEAEVHHIIEHSKGGATSLANGVLVHKHCHPKSAAATAALVENLAERSRIVSTGNIVALPKNEGRGYLWSSKEGILFLPTGTEIKMAYRRKDYHAEVVGADIIFEGKSTTPGKLANEITNSSRNSWRDLKIKFPEQENWTLAADLRSKHPD